MDCLTTCLKCLSAGIGILILLGATLGISITSIVLGAINLNSNCTGISQIPAYLITTGVLGLVSVLLRASDRDSEGEDNDSEKKKNSKFLQLIQLGHFGVLIWGSVILFRADRPSCDQVLFDYAFWTTITTYIILAIIFIIFCCAMSSDCCQACTEHCCGDGDRELTYECNCCGYVLCSDDATKTKKQSTTSSEVVIEMPRIGMQRIETLRVEMPHIETPRVETPQIGTLNRGTEC